MHRDACPHSRAEIPHQCKYRKGARSWQSSSPLSFTLQLRKHPRVDTCIHAWPHTNWNVTIPDSAPSRCVCRIGRRSARKNARSQSRRRLRHTAAVHMRTQTAYYRTFPQPDRTEVSQPRQTHQAGILMLIAKWSTWMHGLALLLLTEAKQILHVQCLLRLHHARGHPGPASRSFLTRNEHYGEALWAL